MSKKTIFFEETANALRCIDIEQADDGFDVVFKTQGFAPDGGLYADVGRDVIGFGFESETAAIDCAESVADVYGFSGF